MEKSSSLYVTTLSGLVTRGIVKVEMQFFTTYHVTSRDHAFIGFCDFMGGNHSYMVSQHFAYFSGHRPCGSRDIADLIFHVTL